jgi:myosin-5
LNQSQCYKRLDGVEDQAQFMILSKALSALQFSNQEKDLIFDILAGILHLGNIRFTAIQSETSDGGSIIDTQCRDHAMKACELLGFPNFEVLEKSLCQQLIKTNNDEVYKSLDVHEAEYTRDNLSKTIYGALFSWLVMRVNAAIHIQQHSENILSAVTSSHHQDVLNPAIRIGFIGVLDIFGFESFQSNSFEQLCINFTNECLQQHFNHYIFEFEQQLYESEQIRWEFISFPDNKETIDLLTHKTYGIFNVCDELVRFP